MLHSPWRRAALIAAGYAAAGTAYIVLSTLYVSRLGLDAREASAIELEKGLGFVLVTAVALGVGLGLILRRWQRTREELLRRSTDAARRQGQGALQVAVAAIAHDMKNMVMALEGVHQELRGNGGVAETREAIDDMGEAVGRLRQLTADLIEHARHARTDSTPREVDVVRVAKDAAHLARVFARRLDCRIEVEAKAPVPVRVDAMALEKALLNLVLNAVDATDGEGTVRLHVEAGDPVVIRVVDDGPGIPHELRDRVFDPFFTTKGARGTGLGLAVARQVIEQNGGRIEVRDAPTGGAELRLSLPPLPATGATDARAGRNGGSPRRRSRLRDGRA